MIVDLEEAVAAQPRRLLRGRFWHQGATQRSLEEFADPARTAGRYHVAGGTGVWYASNQEQAAWAELLRHFVAEGVDPFEVRRRVGHVDVDGMKVLDLTEPSIVSTLEATISAGFEGIVAPSAALAGRTTLVVFSSGMHAVNAGPSRVRQPPPRMADLLTAIRVHRDVPGVVKGMLRFISVGGREAIRRLRQGGSR